MVNWIPNQVGNDVGSGFPIKLGMTYSWVLFSCNYKIDLFGYFFKEGCVAALQGLVFIRFLQGQISVVTDLIDGLSDAGPAYVAFPYGDELFLLEIEILEVQLLDAFAQGENPVLRVTPGPDDVTYIEVGLQIRVLEFIHIAGELQAKPP